MKAGQLRHRVTFQRKIEDVDDIGQPLDEWVHVCTVWACIEDQSGKEIETSQSEHSLINCVITIRNRRDILADMRAVYDGVYYDIKAVLNSKNKRIWLELQCQKGVRYEV